MLEEIFEKYNKKFLSRVEEIRKYLVKNYKSDFSEKEIINVERIDTTKRLEKAGFHKNLSSWKNAYGNVFVSSCEMVDNKQKRFDYKFYFVDEKLDEKEMEVILNAIDKADKLAKRFEFDAAVEIVEEMLNSIKKKKDEVFNRKLTNKRSEIVAAKVKYEEDMSKITVLDQSLKEKINTNEYNDIANICSEIIKIAKSIKEINITKKYEKILESTNQKIKVSSDIGKSEKKLTSLLENVQYEVALKLIESILKKAESIEHQDLINQYSSKKEEIEVKFSELKATRQEELNQLQKVEEIKDKIKQLSEEAINFLENDDFDNSLSKFRTITDVIDDFSM